MVTDYLQPVTELGIDTKEHGRRSSRDDPATSLIIRGYVYLIPACTLTSSHNKSVNSLGTRVVLQAGVRYT